MDSLILLNNPLRKSQITRNSKNNKLSLLPQNYPTVSEVSDNSLSAYKINEPAKSGDKQKISFVKLYFDACCNNEKNQESNSISGNRKGSHHVAPAVTIQLVMEMNYGFKKK